jgi:ATP-dependent helicase/nuclease subunit B
MTITRHFLGWDAPVVRKVRDFLIPVPPEGPVDLRNTLVLVPTQQAGRRLREALTVYCAVHNTYLLAPLLRTPFQLLQPDGDDTTANSMEAAAVWAGLLRTIDATEYPGLFPSGTPARDFRWALQTGVMLQSLRDELAEHGQSVRSVVARHGAELEERDRWDDLERLEALYISQLTTRFGLLDPCSEMLRRAMAPHLPESVNRVILACNPDPTPVALCALEALPPSTDIIVLVHAPASRTDDFDTWGRPLPARWRETVIDIAAGDMLLASVPSAQSELALGVISQEGRRPVDIALGVPDATIARYLESSLAERGIRTYDPSGMLFARHPVIRLLQVYHDLLTSGSYLAFSSLLRNADVLDYLDRAHGLPVRELLTQLDEFQNIHLPGSLRELSERLRAGEDMEGGERYAELATALASLEKLIHGAPDQTTEARLRAFLRAIYSTRELHPGAPDDQEFRTVADRVDETLRALSEGCLPSLHMTIQEEMEVLLLYLGGSRYTLERSAESVDMEGWLELSWNDAPLLLVTGMNDGSVPQRPGNEAFLPDSLRRQLGLRSEDDRLTRDVFLACTLIESRRNAGRVCFIAGKFGQEGEPLRPSRSGFSALRTTPGRACLPASVSG